MKKYNKILISLLTLNLVSGAGISLVVNAQTEGETEPGNTVTEPQNPPAEEPGTQAPPTTPAPEPTSEPWTPPRPQPQPQPQPQPVPVQPEETVMETTIEEITESSEEAVVVDITQLLTGALENPAVNKAYTDYQYVIANYSFLDKNAMDASIEASQMTEVQSSFETYLKSDSESASEEIEIETTPVITEKDNSKVLNYQYFYKGEKGNPDKVVATLQLVFEQDSLKSVAMLNHAPIITNRLEGEFIESLKSGSVLYTDLVAKQATVEGLLYTIDASSEKNTVVFASEAEEQKNHEFVEISNDTITHVATSKAQENTDLLEDFWNYLYGKDMKQLASEDNQTKKKNDLGTKDTDQSTEESKEDKTTEESTEEITEETTEEISEETSAQSSQDNRDESNSDFVINKIPLDFEYEEQRIIGTGKLRTSNQSMMELMKQGKEVSLEQLQEIYGQPTVESTSGSMDNLKYVSIADDKVTVVDAFVDTETGIVKDLKVDNRTHQLYDEFPLKVDDLYTIAKDNDQILSTMNKQVGQPTIVQYIPETGQIRYVWTSFVDKYIQNIEVFENVSEGTFELLYYEPEANK